MTSQYPPMAIALAPRPISTLTSGAKCHHVIPLIQLPARSEIYLASMATSPAPRSLLRRSSVLSPLPFRYLPLPSFLDLYLSSAEGPGSFFGNRSIVIHTSNATRLTCANFTLSTGNSTSGGNSSANTTSPVAPTLSPFTGGAATTLVGAGAVLAGMVAFLL